MDSPAATEVRTPVAHDRRGQVKCVVWDLDDTLWRGILLEDGTVEPRRGVREVIRTLDERGILQSVASRNDPDAAERELERLGLAEYFLYPQINWRAKSSSILAIASVLRIGADSILFVDDQAFERAEVAAAVPGVLVLDALELDHLLEMPETNPRMISSDARSRRLMYRADIVRNAEEASFEGPSEAFLASLNMVFRIAPATSLDLARAEELTVRTNQLNSTGRTYSHRELEHMIDSPNCRLLVAGLDDKYGNYGTIGLAVVETGHDAWTIRLLLMSCRVMSRGVGAILLNHILREARAGGVLVRAEFVPTGRNRLMYITYKFAGFSELGTRDGILTLEHRSGRIPGPPAYVNVLTGCDATKAHARGVLERA